MKEKIYELLKKIDDMKVEKYDTAEENRIFLKKLYLDEAYRNGSITLRLTITEDNGIPQTLAVMTADNGRDLDNDTGDYAHWARRIRKAGRYILIAAACAWLLATARAILTFRRRQRR